MYYEDDFYRDPRLPSVDDDPTLDGFPSSASARAGQASQPEDGGRMNLNGQNRYAGGGRGGYSGPGRQTPPRPRQTAPRRRKNPWGRRVAGLVLCGLLFGGVAGAAFHGTAALLEDGASAGGITATRLSATSTAVGYMDVSGIAANSLPSMVSITNKSVSQVQDWFSYFYGAPTRTQESVSVGSGVLIRQTDDALYIVTNYHVIKDADTLSATFADNETYEARLVGGDESSDIAVIRVELSSLSQATRNAIRVAAVGDSDALVVGQQVVAIGNALGYGQSVTTGVVSALDRSLSGDAATYIQTSAAINPGNSGGALVNMDGEVVGINTVKVASTEVEGMGYAIPMARVAQIVSGILTDSGTV